MTTQPTNDKTNIAAGQQMSQIESETWAAYKNEFGAQDGTQEQAAFLADLRYDLKWSRV